MTTSFNTTTNSSETSEIHQRRRRGGRSRGPALALLALGLIAAMLGWPTTAVADDRPTCTSAGSDPDGDGYGWENGQTCIVRDTPEPPPNSPPPGGNSRPMCTSTGSDPDGDGYGWENGQTCLVPPPPRPRALGSVTISGGVELNWTRSPRASGYNVYRNGQYLTTVDQPPYRDIVSPGERDYEVRAFGPGGLIQSDPSNTTTGRSLPSAVLSLGDSYISGEGGRLIGNTPSIKRPRAYVDGTGTTPGCHRSDVAPIVSADIAGVESFNIACSGATTENMLSNPRYEASSQIEQLRQRAESHHIDMVVLSAGGNDLDFERLILDCVEYYFKPHSCVARRRTRTETRIDDIMVPNVENLVRTVKRTLRQAGQPEARIVLQSYPSPVPYQTRWSDPGSKISHGCPFHSRDMRWVNGDLVPLIDSKLEAIADSFNIEFLSLSDAFDGKEVCGVGVTGNSNTTDNALREWTSGTSLSSNTRTAESMHPNALGQRAMGRCVRMLWDHPGSQYHKCFNNGGLPDNMWMLHRTNI